MGQVFLDKIPATEHIESVVNAEQPFSNGQFLKLGILDVDGESRLVTPAKTEADADVFLADAPIDYGDPNYDIAKWQLKAGKVGRAYHLQKGDVISVTEDLVTGGAKVGDTLTIGENGLGFAKVAAPAAPAGGEAPAAPEGIALLIGTEDHGFDGNTFIISIK